MEPDESTTGSNPNRPRSVPPPLPIPVHAGGWIVVGTFPSHAQWHSARKALSRHGIAVQMQTADGDNAGVDLLVMHTEAEWARDLLARGDEGPADGPTGGFPLHDGTVTPVSQDYVRAMPVQAGLTESQRANYSAAIIVLWIILAVILILMVMAMF
jgi:hypothetical protein